MVRDWYLRRYPRFSTEMGWFALPHALALEESWRLGRCFSIRGLKGCWRALTSAAERA
jgi:hypothetical protein